MNQTLKPYGSLSQSAVVTKVATPIKIEFFRPYGSSANAGLVAKVAVQTPKTPTRRTPTPRIPLVKRLNAGVH